MEQVRTYSDWVIDGDFDWPPKCGACQAVIQDEDTSTTRLGCLRELVLLHAFLRIISASSSERFEHKRLQIQSLS